MALAGTKTSGTALSSDEEVLPGGKPPSKLATFWQTLKPFGWQGLLLTAVLIFLYAPVLKLLVWQWYNDADYSHGFLVPILSAYLIWARRDKLRQVPRAPSAWVDLHILVSVTTLGLLTLAAAAALASFIQARALKNKSQNRLSRQLPSVSDSERLYEGLLILSELVLTIGVASGMATEFAETGRLLVFDHKTLFSLLAFVLIGALIAGRRWGGVRGQLAVRLLLVAYSFVLLGYFGVKFVKQVLLS